MRVQRFYYFFFILFVVFFPRLFWKFSFQVRSRPVGRSRPGGPPFDRNSRAGRRRVAALRLRAARGRDRAAPGLARNYTGAAPVYVLQTGQIIIIIILYYRDCIV